MNSVLNSNDVEDFLSKRNFFKYNPYEEDNFLRRFFLFNVTNSKEVMVCTYTYRDYKLLQEIFSMKGFLVEEKIVPPDVPGKSRGCLIVSKNNYSLK